jgi:glutamate-1-semialdehyde 2,1-aminomutase
MAAGIAALERLASNEIYDLLEARGRELEEGLAAVTKRANTPVQFNRIGSMFCGYFTDQPVHHLADAMKSDRERFAKFFHGMLERGVYLAPSQFEAGFISVAHGSPEIKQTIEAAEQVLKSL